MVATLPDAVAPVAAGAAAREATSRTSSSSNAPPSGAASSRQALRGSGPVSSLPGMSTMIAKTNRTMIAPAYTMICAAARNSAPSIR